MTRGLQALRSFVSAPPRATDRCELCAAALAGEHEHLWVVDRRALACACGPCALLFDEPTTGQKHRRIPRRPPRAVAADVDLQRLEVPVELAFFHRAGGEVRAAYPGPAGAIESVVPPDAAAALPVFEPEVEALLVDRRAGATTAFVLPIDRCFELVGLVRARWRGLSGGAEVRATIDGFLAGLARETA